ncbi:MAG: hypothetical protein IPM54_00840 [Polyangiaceae bacterium]|nr:hypothetical protein [Polyangiaceae bacterium]
MPRKKGAPPMGELESILTPEEIRLLREGYAADTACLANDSQAHYDGMYPGGARAFDAFVQSVYVHGNPKAPPTTGISGKDRERVVIALLASQSNTYFLAIHFYWGLVEGLSVNDMCQTLLLVGGYNGYSLYTNGLTVLGETLMALRGVANEGIAVTPQAALAAIRAAFST